VRSMRREIDNRLALNNSIDRDLDDGRGFECKLRMVRQDTNNSNVTAISLLIE